MLILQYVSKVGGVKCWFYNVFWKAEEVQGGFYIVFLKKMINLETSGGTWSREAKILENGRVSKAL